MFVQVEQFCLGFAAVVHTVLLLVVLERVNRPLTAIWLKWALTGATLWHVSCFFHVLLRQTTGSTAQWLDVACMTTMTSGLLLLNCGILHAALRIHRTGAEPHPPRRREYMGVYVPVLFIVAISASIVRSGSRDFLIATSAYHLPYLAWMAVANLTAAWLFLANRGQLHDETAARFLLRFALSLVLVTVLATVYVLLGSESRIEPWLRLLTSLSPLIPTLIFAWYVFRRRLLPMVFERTLAYGAILLAVFYLHRLTLSPMMSTFGEEFKFDFVVAEGLLLVVLILAYHPLRNRVREGLRYLISGDVRESRDATRQISVDLSRRSGDDIGEIVTWFTASIRSAVRLRSASLVIEEPTLLESTSVQPDLLQNPPVVIGTELQFAESERWIDRSRCTDPTQLERMRELDLIAAFRVSYQNINGTLYLGAPLNADRLSDEQLNAILMLVDQVAAVIHIRQLEIVRQTAERRAMQQEKLSVLGLLSGSLAHELRNPLSSMRTIATLLKEDLEQTSSEQTKDVELIVSEIDRLSETTQRLLDFSRPSQSSQIGVSPDTVIERLMQILGHLARQHDVRVTQTLKLGSIRVAATDSALNDILFNLIKNAIEAVRGHERREIGLTTEICETMDGFARINITDSGPGIEESLRGQIFEPFVTGKTDGTGLGLYLVGQRIQELHGQVHCESIRGQTTFEVLLPVLEDE